MKSPPIAPRLSGSALHDSHCPLPTGNVAVHCKLTPSEAVVQRSSSTPYCPKAMCRCITGVLCPLPPGIVAMPCSTATTQCPRRCGAALQQFQWDYA